VDTSVKLPVMEMADVGIGTLVTSTRSTSWEKSEQDIARATMGVRQEKVCAFKGDVSLRQDQIGVGCQVR
jgi:hypothetical protein